MNTLIDEINEYPKASSETEVIRTPDGLNPFFVIKNNRTRKFIKIGDNEYRLLSSLDGTTTIEDIRHRYKTQYEEKQITQLLEKLYQLRLLEQDYLKPEDEQKLGIIARLIKNFTYEKLFNIKIKIVEPDHVLSRMLPWLRWIYHPIFLVLSLCVIISGLAIFFLKFKYAVNIFWESITSGEFLLLLIPFLAVNVLHEIGHGLTTKYFGGIIYEMGFIFFYFRPAFYCNVTDAYRFSRLKRGAVFFSGSYVQLFVVSILMIIWASFLFPVDLLFRLFVGFTVLNLISIAFNLIPFVKFDGYWLLTSFTGIENLWRKSFDYIKGVLMKYLFGIKDSTFILKQSTTREKIIYIVYSLLAITFISCIVLIVFYRFGAYLVLNFEFFGFIVFTVFMLFVSMKAVASAFKFIITVFKNGIQSILRLVGLVVLAVFLFILGNQFVLLDYNIEAIYKTEKDHSADYPVKIYIKPNDINLINPGQSVTIDTLDRGIMTRFHGSILAGNPEKELYYNTNLNISMNPSVFRPVKKYVMKAKLNDFDGNLQPKGIARINGGRLKLSFFICKSILNLVTW